MDNNENKRLVEHIKKIRSNLDSSSPKLFTPNPDWNRRQAINSVLPENSSLAPSVKRANSFFGSGAMPEGSSLSTGGAGNTMFHAQRPYLPEWETDREQYPKDRKQANFYWRMFHKYDPVFGNAIDMYSDMLVSDFDIVVKGDDSQYIKSNLEFMVEEINLINVFKYLAKEFLVIGEAIPQNFFSEEKGIWTYIGFHNPDDIEVKDAPIIKMDPILNFVPDDSLRYMLTDGSQESMELRRKLPSQFVSKVISRQKIRLSPVNSSYIARKLHPYDSRGTSLASRLWRIWMVEDASYNSTIATYRRSASPLKVIKLGDPSVGWIPDSTQEAKLLQLLAQAEMDPQSFLIWNYGINFEAWGANERAVNIKGDHDTIEKVKLLALGLSRSFMTGDATFASAKSGLQVFLRRLLALRQLLESVWMYPKLFRPVSEINEWTKAKPSEVNHRYRVKKQAQELEEESRIIMPELVWKNKLDPKIDNDLLDAFKKLEGFGIKISKSKISAAVGIDWKEELESHLNEFIEEKNMKEKILGKTHEKEYNEKEEKPGAKPPGGPGGGDKPPSAVKKPSNKDGTPTPPGGADKNVPINDNIEAPGEDEVPTSIE